MRAWSVNDFSEDARVSDQQVQLRRSPKYGTFMALGAGVGVLAAVVLSTSQPSDGTYSIGQVIGFLSLVLGVVGVGLGAAIALIFDRMFAKRIRTVAAQRTTVTPVDDREGAEPGDAS